jgi:Tfp pilus assembly protein PilF
MDGAMQVENHAVWWRRSTLGARHPGGSRGSGIGFCSPIAGRFSLAGLAALPAAINAPGGSMSASSTSVLQWAAALLASAVLAGCAGTAQNHETAQALLHDEFFKASPVPVSAGEVLALSSEMRRFVDNELLAQDRAADPRSLLIQALQRAHDDPRPGNLNLRYDADTTRTAAQTFEDRAGNCLSLVLMTAAFARHLDIPVRFQSVRVDDSYTRHGELLLAIGHINLGLGRGKLIAAGGEATQWSTIDFLPQINLSRQRIQVLSTRTVLAMFMNNRAAEALVAGHLDESYAWVREALHQDPGFTGGVNTLAVIYMRRELWPQAEHALQHVLTRAPSDTAALSNLVALLESAGRLSEAQAAAKRLAELQGPRPYHFHDLGRAALARGDASQARDLFLRELQRQPLQHESHHGLALAYAALGDEQRAAEHLALARDYGGNSENQQRYAAKLAWLREHSQRVH